jgi:hypothetical protein
MSAHSSTAALHRQSRKRQSVAHSVNAGSGKIIAETASQSQ